LGKLLGDMVMYILKGAEEVRIERGGEVRVEESVSGVGIAIGVSLGWL
jgi:hypothetical protein